MSASHVLNACQQSRCIWHLSLFLAQGLILALSFRIVCLVVEGLFLALVGHVEHFGLNVDELGDVSGCQIFDDRVHAVW